MSVHANFWNPTNALRFHRQITKLYKWNGAPASPVNYRHLKQHESSRYVLSTAEEIHLADHIAFLAQRKSGPKNVSAVTIEEHCGKDGGDSRMIIRIAANRTPQKEVVTGLMGIMEIVARYAAAGNSRDTLCEELLDRVTLFSTQRLYERFQPRKPGNETGKGPLHSRITTLLKQMRKSLGCGKDEEMTSFFGELEDLAQCYKKVVDTVDPEEKHQVLKSAVRKSSSISSQGKRRSLEEYLKSLGFDQAIYQNREVLQVDKIARYLGLCEDFFRISTQSGHPDLFRNIQIECCVAPTKTQPGGAVKPCQVHGEVQLVLHYEQYPHDPPPRAIGSSKSACFLCDLFIREHGQYRISHSHNHLYPQWTIPDVHWMTPDQASRFQDVIQRMIDKMERLPGTSIQRVPSGVSDSESRTHLLDWKFSTATASISNQQPAATEESCDYGATSTNSSFSNDAASPLTVIDESSEKSSQLKLPEPKNPSTTRVLDISRKSEITIGSADLPYHQPISAGTPSLRISLNSISVTFGFVNVAGGSLSISNVESSTFTHGGQIIDAGDIPTKDEMRLNCEKETSEVEFYMKTGDCNPVYIKFVWYEA